MSVARCSLGHGSFIATSRPNGRALTALASPPSRRQALLSTGLALSSPLAAREVTAAAQTDDPIIPKQEIAPGLAVSRVIKGCWQLSGGHHGDKATDRTSGAAAVEDLKAFADVGVTTLDTADIYGPSETLIGKYLTAHPEARATSQVLTKFCCFGDSMRQAGKAAFVEGSIDGSRSRLKMKKLDLVQYYWHDYGVPQYVSAALHLADLQAQGKIGAIGVTNFDVPRLAEMVDAGVKVVSSQVQYSLLDTRPDNGMVEYCQQQGIVLLPYGTVAGGFLSDKYRGMPADKVTVNTYSLSKYSSVINQCGGWSWLQSLLGVLHDVGQKHGVGVAEVASRWVLQRPTVAGVIIGARNASHVSQHPLLFGFSLDGEDLGKIQEVVDQGRRPTSDCYSWERGGRW